MNILFVDFETYYDGEFSLRGADSSAEYVMTTELQLMGYAFNKDQVQMAVGAEQISAVLKTVEWSNTALVAHNQLFDARLVHQRLGHNPKFFFDTLGMMAALRFDGLFGGLSLSHLAKVLQGEGVNVEDKGEEVKEAKGKHLYQFSNGQYYLHTEEITQDYIHTMNLTKSGKKKTGKAYKDPRSVILNSISLFERFKEYCVNDVEICRAGFYYMVRQLPREELAYQDMITRCALYPQLRMDVDLLKAARTKAQKRMRDAISPIATEWFNGDYEEAKSSLLSTSKLAIVLKAMGGMTRDEVDDYILSQGFDPEPPFIIPTKVSAKKSAKAGRPVYEYALAKKDDGMVELQQVDYKPLQDVLAARKVVVYANNYEIPRLNRFINEQEAYGSVGMPLKISGAFTHRLGGDLFNVQNLSSGRNEGQDDTMRRSIMSMPGYLVIAADSSQVECRVIDYLANATKSLDEFRAGVDPYCATAARMYGGDANEINRLRKAGDPEATDKRQRGKSARLGLGYGMGGVAYQSYAAQQGIEFTIDESRNQVTLFRQSSPEVVNFWGTCGNVLQDMLSGGSGWFGGPNNNIFYYTGNRYIAGKRVPGIRGPDGLWLNYTELQMRERKSEDGSSSWQFAYYGIKEGRPGWVYIYSAKLAENLTQYFAFAVMKWQALKINQRYPIAFNVHDEWVTTAPIAEADKAVEYVVDCMSQVPAWAAGCPLAAEGAYAERYGDT